MAYKTDYSTVRGLGSAQDGAHHWWLQRISAIALIPLAILFVVPFGRTLGGGYEALEATYGNFGHALIAILFIVTALWHFAHGVQVVIEDYVHNKPVHLTLLIATKLISATLAVAGVLAIAAILFRA